MDNRIDLRPGGSFYYYEVVGVLGSGAHGRVFEIRHPHTGDRFALKTIYAAHCVDHRKVARALAAAKGNYKIDHRNVVGVHDLNMESDGLVWMRTELLEGYTLHDLSARQGPLSLPFVVAAGVEAAHGLHALHENNMIHRDVKPSNLFYTWARAVKVLDLSLVKVFGDEGLETTAGQRVGLGTPAYAAPEQLEGVRPDVRCDVYGLGMTLWELLAGKHPYAAYLGDVAQLMRQQLTTPPPMLAAVARLPARVDEVLARAIAKDPAERYGSMMEMARALADLGAWVATESAARRLLIDIPAGEPPIPGDTNTWRDHRALAPTPTHAVPPPVPSARVVVAPSPEEPALLAPSGTVPMLPAISAIRPADTQPLPSGWVPKAGGTSGQPAFAKPTPAAPAAAPSHGVAGSPGPRDTPAGISRTRGGARASRVPRRAPWIAVIAALGCASLGGVLAVIWFHGHPTRREVSAPGSVAPIAPAASVLRPSESTPATATASTTTEAAAPSSDAAAAPTASTAAESTATASASTSTVRFPPVRHTTNARPVVPVRPSQDAPKPAENPRRLFGLEH